MFNETVKDGLFNSIPIFIPKVDMNAIMNDIEPKKAIDLEEDVKIEKDYLNHLFHYKPSA
jgi:hypothetical protein